MSEVKATSKKATISPKKIRIAALLAVMGPGVIAGLSDDDPAGITTYSVLGAKYGYQMLWVLVASTIALIVFQDLGARIGVVGADTYLYHSLRFLFPSSCFVVLLLELREFSLLFLAYSLLT